MYLSKLNIQAAAKQLLELVKQRTTCGMVEMLPVGPNSMQVCWLLKAMDPNLVITHSSDYPGVVRIYDRLDLPMEYSRGCLGLVSTKSHHRSNVGMVTPELLPWERKPMTKHDLVREFLVKIGEDPNREGLRDTPDRVVRAWETWFGGYKQDPEEVMKVFADGAEKSDEMVLVTDIPVYSHCEHHVAPFFGVAHISYIPDGKVLGLSKLVRLVDIFARRLQIQERLTTSIADALMEHLQCKGVGVTLQCRHLCMESRGVKSPGTRTTTSALRGVFKDEPETRAEFLSLAKSNGNSIL